METKSKVQIKLALDSASKKYLEATGVPLNTVDLAILEVIYVSAGLTATQVKTRVVDRFLEDAQTDFDKRIKMFVDLGIAQIVNKEKTFKLLKGT